MKYQVDKLPLVFLKSSEIQNIVANLAYDNIQTHRQDGCIIIVLSLTGQDQGVRVSVDETTLEMTFELLSAKKLSKFIADTAHPVDCTEEAGWSIISQCIWELISYASVQQITYFVCMPQHDQYKIRVAAFPVMKIDPWLNLKEVCFRFGFPPNNLQRISLNNAGEVMITTDVLKLKLKPEGLAECYDTSESYDESIPVFEIMTLAPQS